MLKFIQKTTIYASFEVFSKQNVRDLAKVLLKFSQVFYDHFEFITLLYSFVVRVNVLFLTSERVRAQAVVTTALYLVEAPTVHPVGVAHAVPPASSFYVIV